LPRRCGRGHLQAEFFSHYYEKRVRPRSAYAFANIDLWARFASKVPFFANLPTQLPLLRNLAKWAMGMPQQRRVPAFAPQTFRSWFAKRKAENPQGPAVLLWPDTFNNYFLPDTARAAVEVLEAAGFNVQIPQKVLCCGRPSMIFGMLNRAKRLLRQTLDTLQAEIKAEIPMVVLEPSCAAVFRDELINLFPMDERAQKLSGQTFLLSEFLEREAKHFRYPQLKRKALIHGHCHQQIGDGHDGRGIYFAEYGC